MGSLQYSILGPLEVRDGEGAVALGGAKQRALLAVLLLHANEAVSRDRLVDELWGGAAPASAGHSLEVYVSQLRKALGGSSDQPLVTRPPGYVLHVESGALDLERFGSYVSTMDGSRSAKVTLRARRSGCARDSRSGEGPR